MLCGLYHNHLSVCLVVTEHWLLLLLLLLLLLADPTLQQYCLQLCRLLARSTNTRLLY
jgi:hypothetical protein